MQCKRSLFILKEVAMPIDSILVSVGVVAMFAILCRRAVVGGFSDEIAAKGHQLIDRAAKTCLVLRDFR